MSASARPSSPAALSERELRRRAARVRLIITDCDGVLTDAGVYYSARGEELKRFNVRDGMGVELLRRARVDVAVLTRETSACVSARAAKLDLAFAWLGVRDKRAHLEAIVSESSVPVEQIAYIGDDVNDLGLIEAIAASGLSGAPADAVRAVREAVHFVAEERGGHGAFRAFADWILDLRAGVAGIAVTGGRTRAADRLTSPRSPA